MLNTDDGHGPHGLPARLLTGVALVAGLLALAGCAPDRTASDSGAFAPPQAPTAGDAAPSEKLLYDTEYPSVGYASTATQNRIARLEQSIADGGATLAYAPDRGWLDSLLEALDIDAASQMLVFSATSLQIEDISPQTPRAIFFNDDTYVAYVQHGDSIEIATMDARLGPVFYTLSQDRRQPEFSRKLNECLRCHDAYSLTGGGVPRFILGSGYIGTRGQLVSHEGWILTSDETPFRFRWGGWYVTGLQGEQVHLGNIIVKNVKDLENLESLRIGNLRNLDGLLDTTPYPTHFSDIVALLVLEHQTRVHNALSRVNFDTREALARAERAPSAEAAADLDSRIAEIAEPLVAAMLFVGEAPLSDRIEGTSGFAEHFASLGPEDSKGRSLRDFNLQTRLFEHRLSYEIYSEAFDSLPERARAQVYARLAEVLEGRDESPELESLSSDEREAIREILDETKPEFRAYRGAVAARPPAPIAEQ